MTTWRALPSERWVLYSHLGLKLVDEFTGDAPRYSVFADLEYQNGSGDWRSIEFNPVVTPSGVLSYPSLGRSADVAATPIVRYRVKIRSEFYRPEYILVDDGIEFDVHPYDDVTPPAVFPTHPQSVLLIPNARYLYESHLRVVRGLVQDSFSNPVANVEVSEGSRERTVTDESGAFSLPLRWPAITAVVALDALDHRNGRTDNIAINLPGDLSQGHLFTIT